MLLTLTLCWMTMATHLSPETLARVNSWEARENAFNIHPGHRSEARLAAGERKTRLAVVVVSGLYNSPHHMRALTDHFANQDLNVLSLRLGGHYEVDPSALRDRVRGAEWKSEVAETVFLARQLGENVLLVGHSTGGLLLTWAAVEDPRDVAGLVLIAPAFGVRALSRLGAWLLETTGFVLQAPAKRVITGRAGLEVGELAREFARDVAPLAPDRLRDVPVWMLNTHYDLLVRVGVAKKFLRSLESEAPRVSLTLSPCALVLHDQLVGPRGWSTRLAELDEFLKAR